MDNKQVEPVAAHDNNNRGALFHNQYYVAGGNAPNYRGSLMVDGKAYRIAAWVKVANSGQKYMSLSVTPQAQQPEQKVEQLEVAASEPVEDLPF